VAVDVRSLTYVSAVRSQAAQSPDVDRRVPWYVYLVAILLLGGDPSSAPGCGTASCGEGFDRGSTGEGPAAR